MMPLLKLLKSLFCLRGDDTPSRFALINLSLYTAFVLFSGIFSTAPALLFIATMVLLVLSGATALRRVRNAGLPSYWVAASAGLFIITTTGISLIGHGSAYFLLLLPAIANSPLILAAAKQFNQFNQSKQYILGYSGPVDLSSFKQNAVNASHSTQRVEPTLAGDKGDIAIQTEALEQSSLQPLSQQSSQQSSQPSSQQATINGEVVLPAWAESVKGWALSHRRLTLAGASFVVLLALVGATLPLWTQTEEEPVVMVVDEPVIKAENVRQHALEMPNNYWLMQDEHQALIIHWPSYDADNAQLWSIFTAKGEQSCEAAVFGQRDRFRTNLVAVENDGNYYASFSPLDSEALIKAIADKSAFSLCGYEFSLKGSRAALNTSTVFRDYL